ncbi:MAG: type II secretion system F family protein [Acetatifactor sp.]|nr:type II secretion system F family protein [Acetatifactor sp.]
MNIIIFSLFLTAVILGLLLFENKSKKRSDDDVYNTFKGTVVRRSTIKDLLKSRNVLIKQGIPYFAVSLFAGIVLFRNVFIAFLFSIVSLALIYWYMTVTHKKKSMEIFMNEFKEAMLSMSNSLKSGASLPVAIARSRAELDYVSSVKESILKEELDRVINEINLGISTDEALENFKERMKSEEVDSFVNAAVITNRVGGDLSEVMIRVCDMISDKIEIKREIVSLTASKRSESNILSVAPLIMVPFLILIAPGYVAPMFNTTVGKLLMGLAIVMLFVNFILAKKIMDIKL